MPLDAHDKQLLNDMGVDVWFERTTNVAVARPVDPTPSPRLEDPEAFRVVGLGMPGVLLLADALNRREETQLAHDILRAVIQSWQAKPKQLVFQWPQVGASGDPQAVLQAFVEKLVTDFDCAVLLVTESVLGRLQSTPIEPIVIPNLSSITLPEHKRMLWRQLQTNTQ